MWKKNKIPSLIYRYYCLGVKVCNKHKQVKLYLHTTKSVKYIHVHTSMIMKIKSVLLATEQSVRQDNQDRNYYILHKNSYIACT